MVFAHDCVVLLWHYVTMLVTCDKYGQGLTCTNHTRHNHRMASEEAIQLRGGDRLSDRLQASSHTSGVSQSPPAYEDEVRSSAVKSFTLPHGVPSFGDRPGQMTEEIHRTRSLQDINQLTLSRGTLGTYRTLPRLKERIHTMSVEMYTIYHKPVIIWSLYNNFQ